VANVWKTRGLIALAALCLVATQAAASTVSDLLAEADRIRSSDPTRFGSLLRRARQMAPQATPAESDRLLLLEAYRDAIAGRYDASIDAARVLAERAVDAGVRYRAALLVANTAAITRDYPLAFRYLADATLLEAAVGDPDVRATGLGTAAALYIEFGRHREALAYADRLIATARTPRALCFGHGNRTRALSHLVTQAREDDFRVASAVCARAAESLAGAFVDSGHARYLVAKGRRTEALRMLESALPRARRTGYTRLIGEILAGIAELRLHHDDHVLAAARATEVLDLDSQHPHWQPRIDAHRVLYRVAEARGDYRAAYSHYRQFHAAESASLDEVRTREFAFQLSRQQAVVREQHARALAHENRALLLERRATRERSRAMRLAIVAMGLAIVGVAYWAWLSRRTHRLLRHLSETDALTGVATRRHFAQCAERSLEACGRHARPVSVLVLDLDHFKRINDECGHAVGDWVLREVARACASRAREEDVVGRLGGEEFAVLLPGVDAADALLAAEALRGAIARIDGPAGGCHLPISASIGVASSKDGSDAYRQLLADADAAMYAAKQAGRNRIGTGAGEPRAYA
jgi:diguanylate cyclase (GGDEF)-like protein